MTPITVDATSGPKIHVLVIGVGEYPACAAAKARVRTDAMFRSVKPLTCAPISAKRVAEWFLETDWRGNNIPLGTVELLVSPGFTWQRAPDIPSDVIQPAVFANVERAWQEWFDRCDTDSGNIALFYFCGHGWGGGQKYLLVEDFGDNKKQWGGKLINFTATHAGMRRCKALTQCYFLDACSHTPQQLAVKTVDGRCLIDSDLGDDDRDAKATQPDNPIFCPSPAGSPVQTPAGRVTPFAEGLLRTLDGLGAERQSLAKWQINIGGLAPALQKVLTWFAATPDLKDRCVHSGQQRRSTVLRTLDNAPTVPFHMTCRPDSALGGAQWSLHCLSTTTGNDPDPHHGDWRDEVPAATYNLSLAFPAGAFVAEQFPGICINPPFFEHDIPARRV